MCGTALQWVHSYLSCRTFCIVYGDVISFIVYITITCSVLQRSVLGSSCGLGCQIQRVCSALTSLLILVWIWIITSLASATSTLTSPMVVGLSTRWLHSFTLWWTHRLITATPFLLMQQGHFTSLQPWSHSWAEGTCSGALIPAGGVYGLAQLGHLKQPRSPACRMNDELALLNWTLFSGRGQQQTSYSVCWMLLRMLSPALGSLTVAWVRCCTINFTGSMSPTGYSSSWQWQFIGVWMAAHHRTCCTTASRSPVLMPGSISILPTVNYLQYLVTGSTFTAVNPFQLKVPQSGTLPRFHPGPDLQCRLFQMFA